MPVNVVKVGADGRLPAAAARGAVSETCNRAQTSATFGLGAGRYQGGLVIIQADGVYDRIRLLSGDNSSQALTNVRMAAYSIDVDTGTATLLGQTGNVANQVISSVYATGTLGSPITLAAGMPVALMVLSAEAITLPYADTSGAAWKTVPPKMVAWGLSATFPATFDYDAAGTAAGLIGLQIIPSA